MAIALTLTGGTAFSQANKTHVLSSDNSSLVVTTDDDGTAYYQYFGPKILDKDIPGLFDINSNYTANTIPAFGLNSYGEQALAVKFPDGNMSLDLYMESMDRRKDDKGEIIQLTFKDKVYPLTVTQYFRTYDGTDIFSTWMDFTNTGKKGNIDLLTFASAYVPVTRGDNWLTQFHGSWGSESWMSQERLPNGQSVLADKAGLRNAFGTNPGFMITIDGQPSENKGEVFGANLIWSGNYKTKIDADNHGINVISGINEETSAIALKPGQTFTTPQFAMVYSTEGKGGVSRAFHKWGRKYGMTHGDKLHDILLNSWEGVYMNVNQEVMDQMMGDIASLGGEL